MNNADIFELFLFLILSSKTSSCPRYAFHVSNPASLEYISLEIHFHGQRFHPNYEFPLPPTVTEDRFYLLYMASINKSIQQKWLYKIIYLSMYYFTFCFMIYAPKCLTPWRDRIKRSNTCD